MIRGDEIVEEELPPPPPPRPVIWPALLALLLLVLAAAGAYWYFTREDDEEDDAAATTVTREREPVPNVVGLREDRARSLLIRDGFEVQVERRRSNRPKGDVIDQNPNAGRVANEGATIALAVSSGPPRGTVPDVTGLRQADAVERVRDADMQPVVTKAFARARAGTVTSQRPSGGSVVKEGALVRLTVSRGPRPVTVPDVIGRTASDAGSLIRRAGLEVEVFEVPSDEPAGRVVAQDPQPLTRAAQGSRVRINVSNGEGGGTTTTATTTQQTTTTAPATTTRPTTTTAPATVTVPSVVGLQQRAAAQRLERAGLRPSVVYVPSTQPQGTVVAQSPQPGTRAGRGSAVQINVSRGPNPQADVAVPDVLGQDEATARQTLQRAGLRVEVIRRATADPNEEGLVVDQQPAAGQRAPRGSIVTIFVGVLQG